MFLQRQSAQNLDRAKCSAQSITVEPLSGTPPPGVIPGVVPKEAPVTMVSIDPGDRERRPLFGRRTDCADHSPRSRHWRWSRFHCRPGPMIKYAGTLSAPLSPSGEIPRPRRRKPIPSMCSAGLGWLIRGCNKYCIGVAGT